MVYGLRAAALLGALASIGPVGGPWGDAIVDLPRRSAPLPPPKRRKPKKPYVAKIDTATSDERADKYLHSAARRRRAEERAACLPVPNTGGTV